MLTLLSDLAIKSCQAEKLPVWMHIAQSINLRHTWGNQHSMHGLCNNILSHPHCLLELLSVPRHCNDASYLIMSTHEIVPAIIRRVMGLMNSACKEQPPERVGKRLKWITCFHRHIMESQWTYWISHNAIY